MAAHQFLRGSRLSSVATADIAGMRNIASLRLRPRSSSNKQDNASRSYRTFLSRIFFVAPLLPDAEVFV